MQVFPFFARSKLYGCWMLYERKCLFFSIKHIHAYIFAQNTISDFFSACYKIALLSPKASPITYSQANQKTVTFRCQPFFGCFVFAPVVVCTMTWYKFRWYFSQNMITDIANTKTWPLFLLVRFFCYRRFFWRVKKWKNIMINANLDSQFRSALH